MKTQWWRERIVKERTLDGFGTRLAELRQRRGVTKRVIVYYEGDGAQPPGAMLVDLARVLGVTTDELLGVQPLRDTPRPKVARASSNGSSGWPTCNPLSSALSSRSSMASSTPSAPPRRDAGPRHHSDRTARRADDSPRRLKRSPTVEDRDSVSWCASDYISAGRSRSAFELGLPGMLPLVAEQFLMRPHQPSGP